MPLLDLDVAAIARLHSLPAASSLSASIKSSVSAVQPAQTSHRITIVDAWGGKPFFKGGKVLELGCGQGDMSSVLVAAVSSDDEIEQAKGSVVAWDPAPGDYGSPMTLATAQANLASRPELEPYLSFSLTTPLSSVLSTSYTHAVLVHSIYYFTSPSILRTTLRALGSHQPPIKYLCLAEYALHATLPEQLPHLLAVMAQSAAEALASGGGETNQNQANVRTVLSPHAILEIADQAGWSLSTDGTGESRQVNFTPEPELQDGRWEVGSVVSDPWMEDVKGMMGGDGDGERAWIEAMRDATRNAAQTVQKNGQMVRTMDVWCAVLTRRD